MTDKLRYTLIGFLKEYKTALSLMKQAVEIMESGIDEIAVITAEIGQNKPDSDEKQGVMEGEER